MGKGGDKPPPPDYERMAQEQRAAAAQQTRANRANTNTPFAGTTWTEGPNGQWTQNTGFSGPLASASANLQKQVMGNSGPMDWSQFGTLGTGDDAMRKGTDAAYNEATRRLGDRFTQGQEGLETKLLNQGLTPGSEAYDRALKSFGQERNDAYAQATDRAILTGSQIGNTAFGNNLASRQQSISEVLRARGQPIAELQQLQGFLAQPGYNQDTTSLAGVQGGQQMSLKGYEDAMKRWEDEQGGFLDTLKGGLGLAASVAPFFLSDERAKTDIRRLEQEALPGVPFALFRYREGMGPVGLHVGVIAQDLQRIAPELVRRRRDDLLEVNYSFMGDGFDG